MTDALQTAREKLGRILEIYAPMGPARSNAVNAMGAALTEFEAAVRADEAAKHVEALSKAQVEANEALARGAQDAATVAAFREAAQPVAAPPVADMQPKFDEVLPAPLGDEAQAPADVQPEAPTLADMGKKKRK